MGALTEGRNTFMQAGEILSLPVAAGKKIFPGALVCIDKADGFAKPGVVSISLYAVGRAEEFVDNSSGLDGALNVRVRRGVFAFANDGTNPVTAADLFQDCFIVNDQTVSINNGATAGNPATRSKAGRVLGFNDTEVWVEIADPRKQLDTVDANLPGDVEFTIGSETTAIRVSAQLKTVDDENVDDKKLVTVWLSDAAGGAVCAVAPSGTVVIGTAGVILQALTAKLNFQIITSATGAFNLDITEAGAKELYVNVAWNGKVFTSEKVTFNA